MLSCDTIHPDALGAQDREAWLDLLSQDGPVSPLLHPDFAGLVGAVRRDARIALLKDGEGLAGAFAFHQRPGGLARPIGAPFADLQGVAMRPDVVGDGPDWLALAGIRAMAFDALADPEGRFGALEEADAVHAVALDQPVADFLESRRALHAKRFKNHRRLARQLEREHGALAFIAPDDTLSHFDTLLGWKRHQFARTGYHDVLAPAWSDAMMRRLFGMTDQTGFGGLMATLTVGGRFAAGLFGVRAGGVFNPWIAAYDPAFAPWSPGQIILHELIAAMPSLGLTRCDLGAGHDHYKKYYANRVTPVRSGLATATGAAGPATAWRTAFWRAAEAAPFLAGPSARLRRRIDQIAAVELDLPGRLQGLARAVRRVGVSDREAAA